jgi:hypothetical protein
MGVQRREDLTADSATWKPSNSSYRLRRICALDPVSGPAAGLTAMSGYEYDPAFRQGARLYFTPKELSIMKAAATAMRPFLEGRVARAASDNDSVAGPAVSGSGPAEGCRYPVERSGQRGRHADCDPVRSPRRFRKESGPLTASQGARPDRYA